MTAASIYVEQPVTPAESRTTLALLAFDGFLCAVLSVLFLPAYFGTMPFPISILVAAVVNLLLVLGARKFTDRAILTALPIFGWLLGFLVCVLGGPGGDLLVFSDWRTLLLFVAAVLPAGVYLFRVQLESMVVRAQG
ncbi:hypothetical protein ERC79_18800 [Rhodococcus sp. ABRD24]|uniref:hypothetical protein n=1 Tax=Rhodococcus sp. ABRD24 TaxID=2507582 RepID=UPI00103F743A|nr:hypothetical protein [Rhodococcus sp. ABRD24]QBJ98821.1 hypothetical protein ERC79_18800 [Rhodococcus sp. ABRD24]